MIKASQKVEQLERKEKQLSDSTKTAKFSYLLNEFFEVEQSFTQNAKTVTFIFQQLHELYPSEQIFEYYTLYLKNALPHFETLSAHFNAIIQDSSLDSTNKIEQIMMLYCPDWYYQFLFDFTVLYQQFERWGGEFECEKWMQKAQRFSKSITKEVHSIYSPLIFIQRLPQLTLMVQELTKYSSDLKIQELGNTIKEKIEAVRERKRKIAIVEEISYLLSQENEENADENQKKATQLFIENRLYVIPELQEIHQKIKNYYSLYFQNILQNLFKQVEELKVKVKKKSSKQLEIFNHELKERLLRYLEYSKNYAASSLNFEPWIHLAHIVLAEASLTGVVLKSYIEKQPDNNKLLLMKCFSDFLYFVKEHGNEEIVHESQEAMELILNR